MANIMATGYVHAMLDKDMDFNQFLWSCARAMGAFIMMRDEPMDAKIDIDELCKPSTHYAERITQSKDDIAKLKAMDAAQRKQYGSEQKAQELAYYESKLNEVKPENEKVAQMLRQVLEWNPPTPEHVGFKDFMADQLRQSLPKQNGWDEDSYYSEQLAKAKKKTPNQYWMEALKEANRNLEYYTEQEAAEIKRCNERRQWIQALVDSVGQPA